VSGEVNGGQHELKIVTVNGDVELARLNGNISIVAYAAHSPLALPLAVAAFGAIRQLRPFWQLATDGGSSSIARYIAL
jgi:hypothetical protein